MSTTPTTLEARARRVARAMQANLDKFYHGQQEYPDYYARDYRLRSRLLRWGHQGTWALSDLLRQD